MHVKSEMLKGFLKDGDFPESGKLMKKICHTNIEFCSAINKNKVMTSPEKQIELEIAIISKINHIQKDRYDIFFINICNLYI